MKIKAVHIIPKSEVITVQGSNGAGKSSLLNSIVMAFKGKKEFPEIPLRRGSKKGIIKISIDGDDTIGPFTITQNITEKSSTLTIKPDKILAGETPRSFLDKLIGKISFDPLQFINEEGKKQRRVLLGLIGIDVDKFDQEEKSIYDERTIKGRELKVAQTKFECLKQYPDVRETEELKVGELSKKLQEAMENNQSIENRTAANFRLKESGIKIRNRIEEMQEELKKLGNEFVLIRDRYSKERDLITELEPINIDEINESISTIESTNVKIRANNTYVIEQANLKSIQDSYDSIERRLNLVRTNRINLIQEAKMPIDGLTFDDSGLLFNGIPLSQCSDGEKLMVSMGISMALNPTIRVVRIKDGSLLDKKNMAILGNMCKDKDFQLWLEKVNDRDGYENGGKVGIFIQEGYAEGSEVIEDVPEPEPKSEVSKKRDKVVSKPAEIKNIETIDDEW
jgi:hypothetical protein